jgi:predicted RNase H-like nuclease (RuvC/YqgF family)
VTPLAAIGEAVKALRTRISNHEARATDFEDAVTKAFVSHRDYINDLFVEVEALKAENQKLHEKVEKQDAAIVEILDLLEALKSA